MKEVGLFICKIREKLWIRSPINSQEDRKSLPLFAVCYFVWYQLIISANKSRPDGSILVIVFSVLVVMLMFLCNS